MAVMMISGTLNCSLFTNGPALTFTLPVLLLKDDSDDSRMLGEGQLQLTSY